MKRHFVLSLLLATACGLSACGPQDGTAGSGGNSTPSSDAAEESGTEGRCSGTVTSEHLDIPYREIEGIDPNLLSLDVYEPARSADCEAAPVTVWVHGGGWKTGDKANQIEDKVSWFNERGWVFVSVNYRLSPNDIPSDPSDLDPSRVTYPAHNEDVAAAVAWVYEHAGEYGADPEAIVLMGHSAGGTTTASISTDERYLAAHGLELDVIRCAVALDSAAYDVSYQATEGANPELYLNAFGTDPAVWDDASPLSHVAAGKGIPDFLLVVRGRTERLDLTQRFADELRSAQVRAEVLEAGGLSHRDVNTAVGDPEDTVVTPVLAEFLERCI